MCYSTESHRKLFVEPPGLNEKLQDVEKLIKGLIALNLNLPLKKRMLVHAIWEVATSSGNFKGRFRSRGVVTQVGVKIQRDHVFQKKGIVERLIHFPDQIPEILTDAVCCVVTEGEHRVLTAYSKKNPHVDGWQRYSEAGITVFDMLTGNERT